MCGPQRSLERSSCSRHDVISALKRISPCLCVSVVNPFLYGFVFEGCFVRGGAETSHPVVETLTLKFKPGKRADCSFDHFGLKIEAVLDGPLDGLQHRFDLFRGE